MTPPSDSLPPPPAQTEEPADIQTSSEEYAKRFAGKSGAWMLHVQTEAVLDLMGRDMRVSILDVGGGHGQLAHPLCERGAEVTVAGSAPECAKRLEPLLSQGLCQFHTADLLALPYEDNAFHTTLCIRLMSHSPQWKQLVRELCRVTSHRVIIDFPPKSSLNFFKPLLFGLKKRLEGNTRPFTTFGVNEIHNEFSKHGFFEEGQVRQFFWPMVIHRVLKNPSASKLLESIPHFLGLTRRMGSPVMMSLISGEAHTVKRDSMAV